MCKYFTLPKSVLIVALVIACGLVVGGGAKAMAGASSTTPDPNLGVEPGFSHIPVGKVPPPEGRITPPSNKPATGAAAGAGLNNSIPACGGASTCRPTGISPTVQAPFSSSSFRVTSEYVDSYSGQDVMLFAGEKLAPPRVGSTRGVVVGSGLRIIVGNNPNALRQFLAPGTPGRLTITAVNGDVVSLRCENGAALSFNFTTDVYAAPS